MKSIRLLFTAVSFLLISSLAIPGQTQVYTPRPNSLERKAQMDLLRAPVEKLLKQKVIFVVNNLRSTGAWAFLEAIPKQPNGKDINYSKTRFAKDYKDGVFGGEACALMHKTNGKWKIVKFDYGYSDVVWVGWKGKYHEPRGIYPPGT